MILVLWTLSLLTVFSLNIGLRVRQKIHVLSRIQGRQILRNMAESAIDWSVALYDTDRMRISEKTPAQKKMAVFHNPEAFREIRFPRGSVDVHYLEYRRRGQAPEVRYGWVDEERKLNVNKANAEMLARLIMYLTGKTEEDAGEIAEAIIDWRRYGEGEIVGFYSHEYYQNLEFPYEEKKADYEVLDELLLVEGVTDDLYDKLKDHLTVYGNGRVNVNTANVPVLVALGFSEEGAEAVLKVRAGPDGVEFTEDDVIFTSSDQAISQAREFGAGDEPVPGGLLGVSSRFFRIRTTAVLSPDLQKKTILCVFDSQTGDIIDWNE